MGLEKSNARFTRAIVRPPGPNFAEGLTTVCLGSPVYEVALEQHERYCRAIESCGLTLARLPADDHHPDSTFVEDTAVVTHGGALITRPGAASRRGEVTDVQDVLARFYGSIASVRAPGTLDGGDVCQVDEHFFVGLSQRTNDTGARQLTDWLTSLGYTSTLIDIRGLQGLLHLKSGLAHLGDRRLAVVASLAGLACFSGYELVRVPADEEYAANCVRANEYVLLAAGCPVFEAALLDLGFTPVVLEMTEFQKMDGGLSCLSIRF